MVFSTPDGSGGDQERQQESQSSGPWSTQDEASPHSPRPRNPSQEDLAIAICARLNALIEGQQYTNAYLQAILQNGQDQHERVRQKWREDNPTIAKHCRKAAEILGEKQTEYLNEIAVATMDCSGDYEFDELIQEHGHKLYHLNLMVTVMSNMGGEGENGA